MEKFKFLLVALLFISACSVLKPTAEKRDVLFSVSGDPVYLDEFDYVYRKSNGSQEDAYTEPSLREYLELYTNFRLKIKEATELQLDTSRAFKEELAKYRDQAAQPYLSSKDVIDDLVKEAYNRMKEEVDVSHILIRTSRDADPKDTLLAYKKIGGIREQVLKGMDFAKMAKSYSEDPSAAQNSGNLGYFSAFAMVYPFESQAYNTAVGQVSSIFRSDFGYHILKVNDRRPYSGQVKVAHIMIRASKGMDPEDSVAAKEKIDEIYKELKEGADWEKMVNDYSEDGYSKVKGGELEALTANSRIVPEFKETALAMNTPNEISAPFQTPYGWHIIKFINRKGLAPFDELEPEVRKQVEKDDRSKISKNSLVKKLKSENSYQEFGETLEWFAAKVDSTLYEGKFNPDPADKGYQKNLFTLNKDGFTCLDFLEDIKGRKPKTEMSPSYYVKYLFPSYVNNTVIKYEEDHLEEKHYDFKMLIQEYHDGILMFNLMEEKIWNESTKDTAGLQAFFETNQADFQWEKRVEAWIFDCKNDQVLETVDKQLATSLFSVSRPIFGNFFFEFRKKELSETDLKVISARLKTLESNKDLRATLTVYSYDKESTSKFKGLGKDRLAMLKSKLEGQGTDLKNVEFVDGGIEKVGKEVEKSRRCELVFNSINPRDLQAVLNKENPLSLNVRTGKFEKGDNQDLDNVDWVPGLYLVENEGRKVRIKVFGTEDPRPKKLMEVKGEAISGYQDYLEKQWIMDLRAKYPVVTNEEVFQSLIKTNL